MARLTALHAHVSRSGPERRLIFADRRRPVTHRTDWVSLDVLVEVQLDDGRWLSPPEATFMRGGPLDCSRRELEQTIRDLIFSEPSYLPDDPRTEPAQLVSELRSHGIDTTLDALAALPLTIKLSDEVEALRKRQSQADSETASQ